MAIFQNFHFKFLSFSILIAGLILIFRLFLPQIVVNSIWAVFLFVSILSYLVSSTTNWLYKKSPDNFLQIKLLGMVIRILAALTFIATWVIGGEENIILFISDFFVLFLFYLVFDIYTFLANLRPISK